MNKRFVLMICGLLLSTLFLNGCQLAIEKADEDYGMNQLCGFYITTESLDTSIDYKNIDWANVDTNDSLDAYEELHEEERFYAKAELVNEDGISTTKYVFDGIAGIPFFQAIVPGNDINENYSMIIMNNDILDIKTHYTDSGIELTGTIYFSTMLSEIFYFNPVFQTPDYEVYMTRADYGNRLSGDMGADMNYQLETEYITRENGEEEILTSSVEVLICCLDPIDRIVFKEINKDDQLVAINEVTKEAIPEAIYLNEDTEYVLVEEHGVDSYGQVVIMRSLLELDYKNEFEPFTCRFMNDKGLAEGTLVYFKR